MHPSNEEDFLQFKDYSNTPSVSSPPQISVNSPTASGGGSGEGKRSRGDPLSDLIYDMSGAGQAFSSGDLSAGKRSGATGSGADGGAEGGGKVSFLTIEYYQQFFNVDTMMVVERIANSIIPRRVGGDYLRLNIGTNPDLYGPFWITVTLIFSIAISGNIASYLQHANDNFHWRYNFHLVSYAATCIFLYANIVPAALWGIFKYSLKPIQEGMETENADYTPSLLSLMCIYGYSLAIYIPVSVLWVIQISFLQWLLLITAATLSGLVLVHVLTPALRNSTFSFFLMIAIVGAHFLLAAGFMVFFFHGHSSTNSGGADAVNDVPSAHLKEVTQTALNLLKHVVGPEVAGNISDNNEEVH